ncbi:MAG: hypothetical protein R2759_10990 [Bacteroidales bacterium]
MNGAAGAVFPEDYNEAGSMWDHLERNDVDFYNFGFSVMFEPASYDVSYKYTGIKQYVNFPVPLPMFSRLLELIQPIIPPFQISFGLISLSRSLTKSGSTGRIPCLN